MLVAKRERLKNPPRKVYAEEVNTVTILEIIALLNLLAVVVFGIIDSMKKK